MRLPRADLSTTMKIITRIGAKLRRMSPLYAGIVGLMLGFFLGKVMPRDLLKSNARSERVAIVVLGGGLQSDGKIYPHVELRCQEALKLYKQFKARDTEVTILPLSGGTPHKPPPQDEGGFPITEARGSAKRLLDLHVPAEDIMEEAFSLDTLGNAYWLRLIHIEPGTFTKMIVVTNTWHMDRTMAFFNKVFALPRGDLRLALDMEYSPAPPGLEGDVLLSRIQREKKSLQFFLQETASKFYSMEELHEFMFTQHSAYASSRLLKPRVGLDKTLAQTY